MSLSPRFLRISHLSSAGLLLAPPLLLNITASGMLAPNEEPKWAVWILLTLVMASSTSLSTLISSSNSTRGVVTRHIPPEAMGLGLFWLGIALSALMTLNPADAQNRLGAWTLAAVTLIATADRLKRDKNFEGWMKHSILLASWALVLFFWKSFALDFDTAGYNRFVQFSRIGHFNFTADALMVLIPLNVWILFAESRRVLQGLSLFTVVSLLAMLGISGSLGGMGGLGAGALITAALVIRRPALGLWSPRRVFLALGVIGAILLTAPFFLEKIPNDLRRQMFSRAGWAEAPTFSTNAAFRQPTPPFPRLWLDLAPLIGARTPMWAATAGMIAERPFSGFGTGSFLTVYPEFSKRYPDFRDFETLGVKVKTNPHNVWLQLAAENGLPLMGLFTALYLLTLLKTFRHARKAQDPFWGAALWALLAAGLDAGVNHVFFNPASLFLMALLLGLIYGRIPSAGGLTLSIKHALHRRLDLAFFPLTLILFWRPCGYLLSEHRASVALAAETQDPSASRLKIQTLWEAAVEASPQNVQALFGLAHARLKDGQTARAKETLKALLRIAPAHTASLNLLASLEAAEGHLAEAAALLQRALALEPDAVTLRDNLELIEEQRVRRAQDP